MQKLIELDDFDRRLLAEVRDDNQQPARILADKVGLSVSAVSRRLRRLREEKVIVADISVIDPALIGARLTMHVLVKMYAGRSRDVDAFAHAIAEQPEVIAAWDVTGDDDFLLMMQVDSMEEYDAFTRRFLTEDAQVRSFKTLIVIRSLFDKRDQKRPLNI